MRKGANRGVGSENGLERGVDLVDSPIVWSHRLGKAEKPMRIALVTETFLPSVDGVVTRLAHGIDWLAAQGHELAVVAPDLGVRDYDGAPVLGVKAITWPVYRSRPWGTPSPKVARYLQAFKPDVVHVWQPDMIGLAAVQACTRLGLPLVTSYHTDTIAYLDYYGPLRTIKRPGTWYERRLHNQAPLTLATSRAMAQKLRERGVAHVAVLPRGVDLDARDPRFASAAMRERLSGGHPERPLLLYVGRVAAEKNLASLEPVMRRHPEWSLAVVGDGPALEPMRRLFAGTPTVFTGFLGGQELSSAFASADAFVFPSTTETLGLVILEAQASGIAVVAAASPATCEQIEDGVNGMVYDPDDPTALEQALERLLDSEPLRRRIADAGHQAALAQGWDRASAALLDAYRLVLGIYGAGWRPPAHPGRRLAKTHAACAPDLSKLPPRVR